MLEELKRELTKMNLFSKTELDLVCNIEKVHMIMEETVAKGYCLETNQARILEGVAAL